MPTKAQFSPEKLSLIDFKLVKGQIETPEDFEIEKSLSFKIDNTLQIGFNLEEKLIRVDYSVQITTQSKKANKSEATANFQLVYFFQNSNLDELAKPDENGVIELDASLGNALASIAYSTSRGILLTRLQGTAFQSFILPVINPNKLLH
ncbi:hypothetical protein [Rufibacter quisquiliarum]|uniref:Preprotein translocase subunit SecB n=1 Tax=Rufibacter quisquiliarum TaxID=1549639 RepID=A0A839GTR0_9BACT|nr:hypothetical protein [Rufibacter quisquiliarum]MBA9078257.1 hypothetical protein [Rufibacter quisquiliarum]